MSIRSDSRVTVLHCDQVNSLNSQHLALMVKNNNIFLAHQWTKDEYFSVLPISSSYISMSYCSNCVLCPLLTKLLVLKKVMVMLLLHISSKKHHVCIFIREAFLKLLKMHNLTWCAMNYNCFAKLSVLITIFVLLSAHISIWAHQGLVWSASGEWYFKCLFHNQNIVVGL